MRYYYTVAAITTTTTTAAAATATTTSTSTTTTCIALLMDPIAQHNYKQAYIIPSTPGHLTPTNENNNHNSLLHSL